MIDVKKSITGFLILATAAICSGVVLSFVSHSSPATATTAAAGPSIAGAATTPSVPTNAFVDTGSVQGNAAELLADTQTTSTQAQVADPNNLTNVFANSFVNGLVASNPNGVPTGANGLAEITPPNTTVVADAISSNPAIENFTAPNWDAEVQSQLIQTTPGSSPSDVTQYNTALTGVFNEYFVSTSLQSQVNGAAANPGALPYISSQIQSALNKTLAIKTPAQFASLQRSLVRVMVYEKNTVQLAETASNDPVKASLILQAEQPKYDSAITALQQQMQQASAAGLSFDTGSQTPVPFIAQLFGIQPARAQWITFDPAVFGQFILDTINNIILQILKNALVTLIQQKVLTAIQGSGAPAFVQDWGAQLVNSFQSAAINTLNAGLACVPPYQSGVLQVLLSTKFQAPNIGVGGTSGQLSCPSYPNLSNLNNGFTNYNDYLSLFSPGGNTWDIAMTLQQNSIAAGAMSQTANQNQNQAQQGSNVGAQCDDHSDPNNGFHLVCANGHITVGTCLAGDTPQKLPNGGKCADGTDPLSTSPAQAANQSLGAALQSGFQNITSANSIVGLLNALTVSLVNQLAQSAVNFASSGINGGLQGIPPGGVTTASSTSSGTQTSVQCLPAFQPVIYSTSTDSATVVLSATGGPIDTSCVGSGSCPSTENSDGTPIYNWKTPGSSSDTPTGQTIFPTYASRGTYTVTVTASTDKKTQATCTIQVQ